MTLDVPNVVLSHNLSTFWESRYLPIIYSSRISCDLKLSWARKLGISSMIKKFLAMFNGVIGYENSLKKSLKVQLLPCSHRHLPHRNIPTYFKTITINLKVGHNFWRERAVWLIYVLYKGDSPSILTPIFHVTNEFIQILISGIFKYKYLPIFSTSINVLISLYISNENPPLLL